MGDEARDEALPMGENAAMESMTRLPRKSKLLLLHNLFFFKLKEIKNAVLVLENLAIYSHNPEVRYI